MWHNTPKVKPSIISEPEFNLDTFLKEIDDNFNNLDDNTDKPSDYNVIKEDESDSSDDEIKLAHEIDGDHAGEKAAALLKEKFNILNKQLALFKDKYIKCNEKLNETIHEKMELEDKCDVFEVELANFKVTSDNNRFTASDIPAKVKFRQMDDKKQGDAIRRALLTDDDVDIAISFDGISNSKSIFISFQAWLSKRLPFKNVIRKTEARFGSSVSAYFIFYRFLFLEFSFLSIILIVFLIMHLYEMGNKTNPNYLKTNGFLPGFMLYSSFEIKEGIFYTFFILITTFLYTIIVLEMIVREDKIGKELDAYEKENDAPYAKEILCCWDNSLTSELEVENLKGTLALMCVDKLEETRTLGLTKDRTNVETFILYARRTFGLFLYFCIQSAAFSSIIYLTINAPSIDKMLETSSFAFIAPFVTTLSLNIINGIMPTLIKLLTAMEQWDSSETSNSLLLYRIYLSNIMNTLILALSYFLLADPMLLANTTLRETLELKFSNIFECRIDEAADSLFTLVINTFVVQFVGNFCVGTAPYIISYVSKYPLEKYEFELADRMVAMLNFLGMIHLSFPFAPLTIIFVPIYLAINIHWESYLTQRYLIKPKKPWKAQKAGKIFGLLYLCTVLLLGMASTIIFLNTETYPKNCNIQDEFVNLCSSAVNEITNICTINENSLYAISYKDQEYPKIICEEKCGPFVGVDMGLTPFLDYIYSFSGLGFIWNSLFTYPYFTWFLIIFLLVYINLSSNSAETYETASVGKINSLETHVVALEAEKIKNIKTISRLKSIEKDIEDEE